MATWTIQVSAQSGQGDGASGTHATTLGQALPGDFDGATINSVTLSGAGSTTVSGASDDTVGVRIIIETTGGTDIYGNAGSDAGSLCFAAASTSGSTITLGSSPSPAPTTAVAADWDNVQWTVVYNRNGKADDATIAWSQFDIVVDYTPPVASFDADISGRIALRGAPKAAKTVSSDLAGRMSFRGVNLYERNPRVWLNSTQTLSGATEMTVTAFNSAGTSVTFTDPPGAPTGSLQLGVENMMLGGGEANTGWISVTVNVGGTLSQIRGRMALRGYGKATKVGASDVAGRLGLRGFDIAAKSTDGDIAGRTALRASSAAAKTSTGRITGRSALRALSAFSLTVVVTGVAVGRAAMRGIGTTAKTISSDLAGRLALRGSDAAAKTASSDITGNVAVRGASSTSKTASGDLSGRMSLRAIIKASVAGTVNGVVRGLIALRGFSTAAKTTTSSASGRMSLRAFVAASAAAVVFAAQIRGRIALRAFSNVAFQKEASIRAAIALRAASAANGVRAGSAVGRLSQRFLGAGAKTASGHPITHIPIRGKSVYALGQLGTISRVVELNAIFDRRISLSGTFDPTSDVSGVFDNVGGLQGKADPV